MITRRKVLQAGASAGLLGALSPMRAVAEARQADNLPELAGDLTVYLGRGEGGLYGDVVDAIRKRNPKLNLQVRRGPSAALANTIRAESKADAMQADLFWSIDASSLGEVADQGLAHTIPDDIRGNIKPGFANDEWAAISGRARTITFNPDQVSRDQLPRHIMDYPDTDFRIGWAPAYGAFQSFITAMRLLEGNERTRQWLRGMKQHAKTYSGELGVVMAAARGEVDMGFANHYYSLRLKQGKPDARVERAVTEHDAGSLINASGALLLNDNPLAADFLRYLHSREVQSYLAREAFEIPLVEGMDLPADTPELDTIKPPDLDLTRLGELQPTLELLRETEVL